MMAASAPAPFFLDTETDVDPGLSQLVRTMYRAAHTVTGAASDYDALIDRVGDARFVLLGEASHGTHEFYRSRIEITKRLIEEKGFTAVAVEADWPAAYRVNRFVRGESDDRTALLSLGDFKRFPTWMWRNTEVLDFIRWLRVHNDGLPEPEKGVGFYGLDLYSLSASIEAVIEYLDRVDPEAAKRARYRYSCLEDFGEDPQGYGYASSIGMTQSCEDEVVEQLLELRTSVANYVRSDGRMSAEESFFAVQNARLAANAEAYYRSMFGSRASSWNLRDRHMDETLNTLADHLSTSGTPARVVVWEHNSHLGDARATEMGWRGELNVGQLARQRYGRDAVLVGFTTYTGEVTAASHWDGLAERKHVRPALPDSYEDLFHDVGPANFMLIPDGGYLSAGLRQERLQRAIGVIYRPETERISHYFSSRLSDQFDAVIHFDETTALEPLEITIPWQTGELPEPAKYGMRGL